MACGAFVIVSNCGGLPEYVQDGINGFVFSLSPDELAEKIEVALEDSDLYRRCIQNGYKTAGDYAWSSVTKKFLCLYKKYQAVPYVSHRIR